MIWFATDESFVSCWRGSWRGSRMSGWVGGWRDGWIIVEITSCCLNNVIYNCHDFFKAIHLNTKVLWTWTYCFLAPCKLLQLCRITFNRVYNNWDYFDTMFQCRISCLFCSILSILTISITWSVGPAYKMVACSYRVACSCCTISDQNHHRVGFIFD